MAYQREEFFIKQKTEEEFDWGRRDRERDQFDKKVQYGAKFGKTEVPRKKEAGEKKWASRLDGRWWLEAEKFERRPPSGVAPSGQLANQFSMVPESDRVQKWTGPDLTVNAARMVAEMRAEQQARAAAAWPKPEAPKEEPPPPPPQRYNGRGTAVRAAAVPQDTVVDPLPVVHDWVRTEWRRLPPRQRAGLLGVPALCLSAYFLHSYVRRAQRAREWKEVAAWEQGRFDSDGLDRPFLDLSRLPRAEMERLRREYREARANPPSEPPSWARPPPPPPPPGEPDLSHGRGDSQTYGD